MKNSARILLLVLALGMIVARSADALSINVMMSHLAYHLIKTDTTVTSMAESWNQLPPLSYEDRALQLGLSQFVLDCDSLAARWECGRVALAIGENTAAADLLGPLATTPTGNSLLYQDIILAFHRAGSSKAVINYYESFLPPVPTRLISDTVALAYLQQAKVWLESENYPEAQSSLNRAINLRPSDLYANYYLWRQMPHVDDALEPIYREALVQFSASAIQPHEPELVDYAAQVIPSLMQDKLWSQGLTARVVSFLVLEYSQLDSVKILVETLAALEPQQAEWPFWLGELYQRRGQWSQSEANYRRAWVLDPQRDQIGLRLAMLCESTPIECDQTQRQARYERYHQQVPDDILGSIKLVQTYTEVGLPQVSQARADLDKQIDDRWLVSVQTGLPAETIRLEENMLPNGNMEQWRNDAPARWFVINHATGDTWWNRGVLVAGHDGLLGYEGKESAAVTGLWRIDDARRSPAQLGFWFQDFVGKYIGWLTLSPGKAYWVGLSYQTEEYLKDDIAATLQLYTRAFSPLAYPVSLPATGGAWHRTGVIVCASPDSVLEISPVVKSVSLGRVHFDSLVVREISNSVQQGCYLGSTH